MFHEDDWASSLVTIGGNFFVSMVDGLVPAIKLWGDGTGGCGRGKIGRKKVITRVFMGQMGRE